MKQRTGHRVARVVGAVPFVGAALAVVVLALLGWMTP